jgi:hypothetical protein
MISIQLCIERFVISYTFKQKSQSDLNLQAGKTDTVGHLGGLSAGVGYFLFRYFRLF